MPNNAMIKYFFLFIFVVFYLGYTIKYIITFRKSLLFSKRLKSLHIFLFFLIPFVWIFLIKELSKSAPGSYEFPDKRDIEPSSDPYISSDGG
jgi:hypothetical protein